MVSRIWVDVEDLFLCAQTGNRRPTGIQRLTFELCRGLHDRVPGTAFVRHAPDGSGFVEVHWDQVAAVFRGLASDVHIPPSPLAAPPPEPVDPVPSPGRRRPTEYLPLPLAEFVRAHWRAVLAWPRLLRTLLLALRKIPVAPTPVPGPTVPQPKPDFELVEFVRDDILFAPGSTWLHKNYAAFVGCTIQRHRLRFGVLIYDIIPLRRPEWCDQRHTETFRSWLDEILPICGRIVTISRHAGAELEQYASARKIGLHRPVTSIPIGGGFARAGAGAGPRQPERPPPPGDFVLFVSTIEIRKNHQLLLRVWRHLIEQMPAGSVPLLVFAGQIGWMVTDLMAQLENSNFLGGHVVLINDATDAELTTLYRSCLFTVFPSLYEGWGLPVTESLSLGKPCIASHTSSLPEAGRGFARYFDPEDVTDATTVLRTAIEDREGLRQWEERIRREYRPVPWEESALAVARAFGQDATAPSLVFADPLGQHAAGLGAEA